MTSFQILDHSICLQACKQDIIWHSLSVPDTETMPHPSTFSCPVQVGVFWMGTGQCSVIFNSDCLETPSFSSASFRHHSDHHHPSCAWSGLSFFYMFSNLFSQHDIHNYCLINEELMLREVKPVSCSWRLSLVSQWLRIHIPMPETWFDSQSVKLSHASEQLIRPWPQLPSPASRAYMSQTIEVCTLWYAAAHPLQQEKPLQWKAS